MTRDEFEHLQVGDLVRHKLDHRSLIVTANYGNRVMAVAAVDITNTDEWEVVAKATYQKVSSTKDPGD